MKLSRRGLLGALGILPFLRKKPEPEPFVPVTTKIAPWTPSPGWPARPREDVLILRNDTPELLEKGSIVQLSRRGNAAIRPIPSGAGDGPTGGKVGR